jgi:hypothetical protein
LALRLEITVFTLTSDEYFVLKLLPRTLTTKGCDCVVGEKSQTRIHIIDDDANAPLAESRVGLGSTHYGVGRLDGSVVVSIIRSNNEGTIQIEYETKDETAHAGEHYAYTSGAVFFAPGESRKDIQIEILSDRRGE